MPMASTCSSTPSRSKIGKLCGSSDSPMWKRGWCSFSSKVTRQPFSASKAEIVEPAGPPPTTRTSHSFMGVLRARANVQLQWLLGDPQGRTFSLLSRSLMDDSCRPFPIYVYVVSDGAVVQTLDRLRLHLPAIRDLLLRAEEVVRSAGSSTSTNASPPMNFSPSIRSGHFASGWLSSSNRSSNE